MGGICEYGGLKGRNIIGIYEKKRDSKENSFRRGKSGHKNKN